MHTTFATNMSTTVVRPRGYAFAYRPHFGRDLDIHAPVNRPARRGRVSRVRRKDGPWPMRRTPRVTTGSETDAVGSNFGAGEVSSDARVPVSDPVAQGGECNVELDPRRSSPNPRP